MTIASQNKISFPVSLQVGRALRTQALSGIWVEELKRWFPDHIPVLEKQGPSDLSHSLQRSESTLMDLTTADKMNELAFQFRAAVFPTGTCVKI